MEIIDITNGIFSSESGLEDVAKKYCFLKKLSQNDSYNLSAFFACSHTGTHIDAPLHFVESGDSADKIPLENFIGPCRVVKVPEGPITGEYVENNFPRGYSRILIKSSGKASFYDHAAYSAIQLGFKMIGVDSPEISVKGYEGVVHRAFFNAGVGILENLSLDDVDEGTYYLVALPIKLDGLEAAPARAILIKDSFSWKKR